MSREAGGLGGVPPYATAGGVLGVLCLKPW